MITRRSVISIGLIFGMSAGATVPVGADSVVTMAWTAAKAFVQCFPDSAGNTGIALPGLGINKSKKCTFSFSGTNSHSGFNTCIGVGASDSLKKGNKKAPAAGLCSISATGLIGPRFKSPANIGPLPNLICIFLSKPKASDGTCTIQKQQQFGGPWCGASQGEDGSGSFTVGTKTISFNRLRFQSQGTLLLVSGSAFKPGVEKPGQAGPLFAMARAFSDVEKVLGGVPNSSCFANAKNFSVDGIAVGLVLGVK